MNGQRGEPKMTPAIAATTWHGMSLISDQLPPASLPAKPKLMLEERRARQADRLITIRLRMAIYRYLDDRSITTPAAIGEALGMLAEAASLLARHQWCEGDVARLQAAAARLGVRVPVARGDDD